jgi:hypothetical protein
MPRESRSSIRKSAARELERKALDLRVVKYSYEQIANELGCSVHGAYMAVSRALERHAKAAPEVVKQVRELELNKLDVMESVLVKKMRAGDTNAGRTILLIQERRAKLLGIDATPDTTGDMTVKVIVLPAGTEPA